MIKTARLFFFCLAVLPLFGQNGFVLEKDLKKVGIPFKFINNLIFIPLKVNSVELNFLLDSGVEETILFSMDDKQNVNFNNVEKITLKGLGSSESIEGLKSTNNILETHGLKLMNHILYIVLDQKFNISSHVGIPVNGIIGSNFFKNNLIEINYIRKKIFVYAPNNENRIKIEKKFVEVPITIEKSKPYVEGNVFIDNNNIPVKLLIDIGNSDAVWLFQNAIKKIEPPSKNFDDFLGQGFSGEVYGKRALISKFSISNFEFNNPIVAFPDSSSTKNVKMAVNRSGSIGSEILRRFTIVFDYSNRVMYLKKNNNYNYPFNYNKSGIEIQHNGYQWVNETIRLENTVVNQRNLEKQNDVFSNDFKYKLELKPVYIISNIRKNSQADTIGLKKEDVIISINGMSAYQYSLNRINLLLRPEEDKWLYIEVDRAGITLVFKLFIQNEL
ncbi:PDZ domain-containing protein [Flavobacterium sp.]|uniref:PDZ domain-containing protein n=1 Tax=Flavobacterium sp. TaxID=239 RepID=UPI0038FCB0A7